VDLLGVLLPQRCAVCAAPGGELCALCRDGLGRLTGPLCARCGAPTAWPVARCRECSGRRLAFASARAAIVYDRAAATLVRSWKERGLRKLACCAAELVAETVARPEGTVTFVPPDSKRALERGHHPAERLALELATTWDLSLQPLLRRNRRIRPQRGLPMAERRKNVVGAFAASASAGAVVLVDDVYTTGSTAAAAASALRKAGARSVHVVTLARAVRGLR
jgi:predicted amidophosphoribosyltransferase